MNISLIERREEWKCTDPQWIFIEIRRFTFYHFYCHHSQTPYVDLWTVLLSTTYRQVFTSQTSPTAETLTWLGFIVQILLSLTLVALSQDIFKNWRYRVEFLHVVHNANDTRTRNLYQKPVPVFCRCVMRIGIDFFWYRNLVRSRIMFYWLVRRSPVVLFVYIRL